jgi:long-chain acyl-CoA synthetase
LVTYPWLASYPVEVPPQLDISNIHVTEWLRLAAERYAQKEALYFMGTRIRFTELERMARKFADNLIRLGLQPGDRVSLMLANCPQYVIAYYGILYAGGVVVQTNPLYAEHDLLHQLTDSEAKFIVCLDLVYPRLRKVLPSTSLRSVIITGVQDYLPFPKNMLYPLIQKRKGLLKPIDYESDGLVKWSHMLRSLDHHQAERRAVGHPDDVAVLQYTGGTTGKAKGAMLTHRNLVANVEQCQAWMYRCKPGEETLIAAVPLFHVYGMTVCMNYCMSIGARMVLVPRFDVKVLLQTIHRERPTLFPGAPTMYIAVINHPELKRFRLDSIHTCISGSAPLPKEVQDKFEALTGGKIVEGFGLSEASPVTHCNPIWGRNVNGSIGVPWPNTEAKIMNAEGAEARLGEVGELIVRGPQVMKGYYNQPEETAVALKDGWLHTGDLAYMDEAGYFYIVDRKKDVIIASGFKVYPREVEEVLFGHSAVQEAAVVGAPDAYRGETVKAFIVLKEGQSVTEKELDVFCREKLASYKVPRLYEFRRELPKSFIGKTLRRVLVDEERQRATKASEASEAQGPASKQDGANPSDEGMEGNDG